MILEDKVIEASVNLSFISLLNSNFDGIIIHKNDINKTDKFIKLPGKWFKLIPFQDSSFLGVSKMLDLFHIDYDSIPKLKMDFFPFKLKIRDVACGADHILVLSESPGRVFSKGLGSRGQLGHGDLESCEQFKEISNLGCVVSKISCGFWHSVGLTEAGDVYTWGWNHCGQLGVPNFSSMSVLKSHFGGNVENLPAPLAMHTQPVLVQFPIDDWSITHIDCGSRHTCCLNEDGAVFCFGWGGMGQLGKDDGQSYDFPIPIDDFVAVGIQCTEWATMLSVLPHPDSLF